MITPGEVTAVPDAARSYAWYGTLGYPQETDRYLLTIAEGDEIRLSLATPDPETAPALMLTGFGIPGIGTLPGEILLPEGHGYIAVMPDQGTPATYEPFTPMALYERATLSLPAPAGGDYTVLISGDRGRYLLATG
jgi:hypothetical protein